jgi:hypothetical protein
MAGLTGQWPGLIGQKFCLGQQQKKKLLGSRKMPVRPADDLRDKR